MSSYFADPPPSHAADPKVKENPKKENQKKENPPGGGGEGAGSGREEGSGITWRERAPARQGMEGGVPIGCVPKPFRMLCHSLCINYVYEMYVNLMSQLNSVLAVSTWCRWCGLAQ